jgi:HSP20 family protein
MFARYAATLGRNAGQRALLSGRSQIYILRHTFIRGDAPQYWRFTADCLWQENEMMNLVYYHPGSLMDRWQREVAQILYGEPDSSQPAVTNNSAWTPLVDLQEEETRFVLRADVPGVALKDIEVTAEDGTLTIRGERRTRQDAKSDGSEHIERFTGTFVRRFTLPESAQAEGIKARCTNGVLEIEIPKQPRVEAKRIAVTVN